jgi:hypothetical protein
MGDGQVRPTGSVHSIPQPVTEGGGQAPPYIDMHPPAAHPAVHCAGGGRSCPPYISVRLIPQLPRRVAGKRPARIRVHLIPRSFVFKRDLFKEVHRKQFHPSRESKKNKEDGLARYKAARRFHSVKFAMAAISSCDWTGLERCI